MVGALVQVGLGKASPDLIRGRLAQKGQPVTLSRVVKLAAGLLFLIRVRASSTLLTGCRQVPRHFGSAGKPFLLLCDFMVDRTDSRPRKILAGASSVVVPRGFLARSIFILSCRQELRVGIVVITFLAGLFLFVTLRNHHQETLRAHTLEVMRLTSVLENDIAALETGHRGYLLTGNKPPIWSPRNVGASRSRRHQWMISPC